MIRFETRIEDEKMLRDFDRLCKKHDRKRNEEINLALREFVENHREDLKQ